MGSNHVVKKIIGAMLVVVAAALTAGCGSSVPSDSEIKELMVPLMSKIKGFPGNLELAEVEVVESKEMEADYPKFAIQGEMTIELIKEPSEISGSKVVIMDVFAPTPLSELEKGDSATKGFTVVAAKKDEKWELQRK